MIDIAKLRGKIAEKGTSQAKLAKTLNITPKTFYEKMKKRNLYQYRNRNFGKRIRN